MREFDCTEDGEAEKVGIKSLDYYDFDRDGKSYLVVVASNCGDGTGGPSIHAVFARDGHGGFRQVAIPNIDSKYYEVMSGKSNYDLSVDLGVDPGLLVETWYEEGDGRSPAYRSPLVIKYKWHDKRFLLDSMSTTSSSHANH